MNKRAAVPGAAPPDDRHPEPLTSAELAEAKAVTDSRERLKIHRFLLTESMRRLRAGRTLERAHGVIHPEMTAIIRDTLRLAELVFPGGSSSADEARGGEESGPGATEGSRLLCGLVEQHTEQRVAKLVGVHPAKIRKFMAGQVPDAATRRALELRLRIPADAWDKAAA